MAGASRDSRLIRFMLGELGEGEGEGGEEEGGDEKAGETRW